MRQSSRAACRRECDGILAFLADRDGLGAVLLAATALRHLQSLNVPFDGHKSRDTSDISWPTMKSWLQHCCLPALTDFCLAPLSTFGAQLTCLTLSSWPTFNIVPYLSHLTGLEILQLESTSVDEEGADQSARALAAHTLCLLATWHPELSGERATAALVCLH